MISKRFFERDSVNVARALLGKKLVVGNCEGIIVETEAYKGKGDLASHASRGKTKRNETMFGHAGRAYVYFTYGNHFMFNIVTESHGTPGAVLIRAIEPTKGIKTMQKRRKRRELTNGPGKLTQALGINKKFNGRALSKKSFCVKNGIIVKRIEKSSRVGITQGKGKKWRFFVKGNSFVSKAKV